MFRRIIQTALITTSLFGLSSVWAGDIEDLQKQLAEHKYAEAVQLAQKIVAKQPDNAQALFLKGVAESESGQIKEAMASFNQVIKINPLLPEPYNNLAVLHAGQGHYDKARAALSMAIKTNPSYATAHENLGDVYAKLASQAYTQALQLDQSNQAIPPKLQLIKELTGTHTKAVSTTTQNPKTSPTTASEKVTSAKSETPKVAVEKMPKSKTPELIAKNTDTSSSKVISEPQKQAQAPTNKPNDNKPATSASATVTPAPAAKTAPSAENNEQAAIDNAVLDWAAAWSSKKVKAYLDHYHPQFTPAGGKSHAAWEAERKDRILGKKKISVRLSDMKIELSGQKAIVTFKQDYAADQLKVSSRKTLELVKHENQWLITKESTG